MGIRNSCFLILGGVSFWILGTGPLKPYWTAVIDQSPPQLILVLGGDVDREHAGIGLANALSLPLVVSGGSNPEHAEWLIKKAGIPPDLVKLDYRAQDTLGNFTSAVDDLSLRGIHHVLLVTSEDHLARAMSVGQVVAGSRGIRLTGISVPCSAECVEEGKRKLFFDSIRAMVWVITGKDLKVLAQQNWPGTLN